MRERIVIPIPQALCNGRIAKQSSDLLFRTDPLLGWAISFTRSIMESIKQYKNTKL